MKAYKAALLGCGARGGDHCEAYKQIEGAEATACFSPDRGRREAFAKRNGLKPYESAEEMLERERPDIVHITSYPDVRLGLMRLVSEAGVPLCVVEKPLAEGVLDWRALCELEAASKTKFAVSHQVRWNRRLARCVKAAKSGRLGKVLFLDLSAGMNISGQGTHTLNYGMALNGDSPVSMAFGNAQGWDLEDKRHPAPKASEAMLQFENGARALWSSGPVSPKAGDPGVFWQHVRVAAYAERGRVNFEEFGKWEIVEGAASESGDFEGMEQWRVENLEAQAALHKAMFKWLEGGEAPGTNLKQSLHEWTTVLALYQSALERRPVELKGFNPPEDLVERYRKEAV